MKNRTITTSVFAASIGLTVLVGSPAANAASENGNACPAGAVYSEFRTGETRSVVTHPAHTVQREISPAIPAVTRVEFEFAHAKNNKLETRWEAEGWNAEGTSKSAGWVATGQSRTIIITPAVDAVMETTYVPEATIEVPVVGFTCLDQGKTVAEGALTHEAPVPGGTTGAAELGGTAGGTVEAGDGASAAPDAATTVRHAAVPERTEEPESGAVTAQAAVTGDLANTGAGSTSALLTIGALVLGGGAALLGATRLRGRRTTT